MNSCCNCNSPFRKKKDCRGYYRTSLERPIDCSGRPAKEHLEEFTGATFDPVNPKRPIHFLCDKCWSKLREAVKCKQSLDEFLQSTSESSYIGQLRHAEHPYSRKRPRLTSMHLKMEAAIKLYKEFTRFPQVTGASILRKKDETLTVDTTQTQRDLERSEKIKFSKSYVVRPHVKSPEAGYEVIYRSTPQELQNEIWRVADRTGTKTAVLRKVVDKKKEEKQYIEIWDGNCKKVNTDVLASEKHGKIYEADVCFGCFEWSNNGEKLLYVAEKKYKKAVSYFSKSTDKEGEEPKTVQGEEFVFREDWGEQLVGKHHPVLCVLEISSGEITVIEGVPEHVSPGLAQWTPDDSGIVFTGWNHDPYRLGLIYCPIRKAGIYHVNIKSGSCALLSADDKVSYCSRFSPDGASLVFLQNDIGGTHMQCSKLLKYHWKSRATDVIVDEVKQPSGDGFPGLYSIGLPSKCWSEDNTRVIINTFWRSQTAIAVINIQNKSVTRLNAGNQCGMSLMCIDQDVIVAQATSLNTPHYLVIGKLPAPGKEGTIKWSPLDEQPQVLSEISFKINSHSPSKDRINQKYPNLDYESILIFPTTQQEQKKLMVFPHGGPHSLFTTDFNFYVALFCQLGFSILMVNYRGSIGFGADSINSLPGKVGDQDVKDVQCAAEEIIEKESYDAEQVVVWGGSHGGFLTCHLIGQYPDFYKAAVSRNPVTNIASMLASSDIADWCCVEAGLQFDYTTLADGDVAAEAFSRSPMQYVDKIKTPLMLMVGLEDKRVPPKQSFEMYKALKSRNLEVRFLAYPDNNHPIVKVDAEADAFINMYKWFTEHLKGETTIQEQE